jgi:ribonuclease P/MRP protein subunit RPP40
LPKLESFRYAVEIMKPDVIGITEGWTNEGILDEEINIEGYDLYRQDRNNKHKGGGVLLYVKSSLQSVGYNPVSEFPEHVWCKLPVKSGQEMLIGVCYKTPNPCIYDVDLDKSLRQLISDVSHQRLLLMGDFNYGDINWINPNHSPVTEASILFVDCLDDNFLTQHVKDPTRITNTSKKILDLVITDQPDAIEEVEVLDSLDNSDHQMLRWSIVVDMELIEYQGTTKDYNKADYESIKDLLRQVNWEQTFSGDVNQCWNEFRKILQNAVNQFVPDRHQKFGKYKKAIWMTHKAVKKVKRKHNLFRRYRDINNGKYIEAVREAKIEIKRAKLNFEKKLAANIKKDNKSFYAYARRRASNCANVGPLLGTSGVLKSNPAEIAEELNNYFSSVFTREDLSDLPSCDGSFSGEQVRLEDIIITEEAVSAKLGKLRPDKATGADDISPRLLTEIHEVVCHPLTLIFQKSLHCGEVPRDWKLANVSPIYKKDKHSEPSNYRPISLTSQICKLFEAIIRDSIVDHLEHNNLINGSQHGFRRGRSCLTNLLIFLDKVTRLVDEGKDLDIIYLDFAKAFDKVPHQRLLIKLREVGINGNLLKWISSWLSGRQQRVVIRGRHSSWNEVISGVPQGSVLGPVLFLIFINNIDQGLLSHILKFADDTKIFNMVTNEMEHNILQEDLTSLETWSKKWQMDFNATKCKVMHVGKSNQHFRYEMENHNLSTTKEEKDLGVMITDNLKSGANCQAAYRKANRVLGMISRTISFKSTEILLPLFKTLVRPLVEYCVPAWSPHYSKDKILLERIQHRFTRMIPGLKKLEYSSRLDVLHLWTLEERRNRSDLIELFKIFKGLTKIRVEDLFERSLYNSTRGHSLKLRKQCCRTDLRKFFFSERVICRWNLLDEDTVRSATVNSFKNSLQRIRESKRSFFTDT